MPYIIICRSLCRISYNSHLASPCRGSARKRTNSISEIKKYLCLQPCKKKNRLNFWKRRSICVSHLCYSFVGEVEGPGHLSSGVHVACVVPHDQALGPFHRYQVLRDIVWSYDKLLRTWCKQNLTSSPLPSCQLHQAVQRVRQACEHKKIHTLTNRNVSCLAHN